MFPWSNGIPRPSLDFLGQAYSLQYAAVNNWPIPLGSPDEFLETRMSILSHAKVVKISAPLSDLTYPCALQLSYYYRIVYTILCCAIKHPTLFAQATISSFCQLLMQVITAAAALIEIIGRVSFSYWENDVVSLCLLITFLLLDWLLEWIIASWIAERQL